LDISELGNKTASTHDSQHLQKKDK
jgi:hypothetical protein